MINKENETNMSNINEAAQNNDSVQFLKEEQADAKEICTPENGGAEKPSIDDTKGPEGPVLNGGAAVKGNPVTWIPYLSYLRAVACFVIVILHTMNVAVILYGDSITPNEQMYSMMAVYLCMWSVPCFIMITGVLQLNPEYNLTMKTLFTKLIWRILKALVLCCLVFRLFDMFMDGEAFTVDNVLVAFKNLFLGQSWAHIWYLYMLIGLYLLMPVFRLITKNADGRIMKYGIAVTVFFISIVPITQMWGLTTAFVIPLTTIFPVYLFAGYMIHNNIMKIGKLGSLGLIILGAGLIVVLTLEKYRGYVDLPCADMPDILIGSYASIAVVILSFGAFPLLKGLKLDNFIGRFLRSIDKCSFGIYLFHMIFIRLVLRYWQFNPYEYGIPATAGVILLIFAVSYLLVFILRKLPILRKII